MSEPIVFISHQKIKAGKLAELKQFIPQGAAQLEANKPGTVVFLAYANADGTELTIVHIFPDGDAMASHMEGAGDRAKRATEFMEPMRFEIYGKPSDTVLEMMKRAAGTSVKLELNPQPFGGYLRLESG